MGTERNLPDNWIDVAAAHGATQWVKQFIKAYLPQLHSGAIAPEQFALSFRLNSRSEVGRSLLKSRVALLQKPRPTSPERFEPSREE